MNIIASPDCCCALRKIIMDENLMAINVYCFLDILHSTLSLSRQQKRFAKSPWCIVEPSVPVLRAPRQCRGNVEGLLETPETSANASEFNGFKTYDAAIKSRERVTERGGEGGVKRDVDVRTCECIRCNRKRQ